MQRFLSSLSRRTSLALHGYQTMLLCGLAVVMIAMILTPAGVWAAPEDDDRLTAFDATLMYANATGGGQAPGSIVMDPHSLRIETSPGSSPVVHLATGPLTVNAHMSMRIDESLPDAMPAMVSITSPYGEATERIVFKGGLSQEIMSQKVEGDRIVSESALGNYALHQTYSLKVDLNREKGTFAITGTTPADEVRGDVLELDSQGSHYESHLLSTQTFRVSPGETYRLSAAIRPLVTGPAGLSVEWLDASGDRIAVKGSWSDTTGNPDGWSPISGDFVAPAKADAVRLAVAVAPATRALIDDVRLISLDDGRTVLDQSEWLTSVEWRRAEGTRAPVKHSFQDTSFKLTGTEDSNPALFQTLRMAISLGAESGTGSSSVTFNDPVIELPHQRWMAVRTDSGVLRLVTAMLGLAGIVALCLVIYSSRGALRLRFREWTGPRVLVVSPIRLVSVVAVVGTFLLASALLAGAGSLNADVIGARVWAYTAQEYGLDSIYFLPNMASAEAQQWMGSPWQEAGFPYGPTMAYIFGAIGWFYHAVLHQPALGTVDSSTIDITVRFVNALFAVGCAAVIWMVARNRGVLRSRASLLVAVFLLSPVLILAGSVWGSTQTISLFFVLVAIAFADRMKAGPAWTFLLLAVMTRPQSIAPIAVLAIVLLFGMPWRKTIRGLALAVIAVFVVLLPLSLTVSPTLPADVIGNALFMHVGSGNDPWTLPVSWGAFTLWPILTTLTQGVGGVDALLYPATTPLSGLFGLTPYESASPLKFLFLAVMMALAGRRARDLLESGQYLVVMTAAALSLLILGTGTPSYHLVLPATLALMSTTGLTRLEHNLAIATLNVTLAISMYGMGAYWLSAHPDWSVGVFDENFWATGLGIQLVQSTPLVFSLCAANVAILVLFTYRAFRPAIPATDTGRPASVDLRSVANGSSDGLLVGASLQAGNQS